MREQETRPAQIVRERAHIKCEQLENIRGRAHIMGEHEEFQARTMWSVSNAFTSAFKELDPIPRFRATAKRAGLLERS
jgi:hypothetical protein